MLKFGDTPTCIDQGNFPKVGNLATVQGYGKTENDTNGILLEANVTIISNNMCLDQFETNITNYDGSKTVVTNQLCTALPFGLKSSLLCTRGIQNERKTYSGSCKGDSGGPLTVQDEEDKKTLVGIVSGICLFELFYVREIL